MIITSNLSILICMKTYQKYPLFYDSLQFLSIPSQKDKNCLEALQRG